MKKLIYLFVFALSSLMYWNCSASYSFTGASISPDVKTVSVAFFEGKAPLAPPNASQLFTEAMKDIFLSQTNLTLVTEDGDLEFEGEITSYNSGPAAIQGTEAAAITRVTMGVKVKFTNNKDETQSFESTFSRFEDFETSKDLSSVEVEILQSLNDQLTQDIFNKAVTNW
tara:strand:+ start:831 stop:1340 length:510 start_codon:yes stop_codon:yes gene_type:complete